MALGVPPVGAWHEAEDLDLHSSRRVPAALVVRPQQNQKEAFLASLYQAKSSYFQALEQASLSLQGYIAIKSLLTRAISIINSCPSEIDEKLIQIFQGLFFDKNTDATKEFFQFNFSGKAPLSDMAKKIFNIAEQFRTERLRADPILSNINQSKAVQQKLPLRMFVVLQRINSLLARAIQYVEKDADLIDEILIRIFHYLFVGEKSVQAWQELSQFNLPVAESDLSQEPDYKMLAARKQELVRKMMSIARQFQEDRKVLDLVKDRSDADIVTQIKSNLQSWIQRIFMIDLQQSALRLTSLQTKRQVLNHEIAKSDKENDSRPRSKSMNREKYLKIAEIDNQLRIEYQTCQDKLAAYAADSAPEEVEKLRILLRNIIFPEFNPIQSQ